jgi:hypothetical protein
MKTIWRGTKKTDSRRVGGGWGGPEGAITIVNYLKETPLTIGSVAVLPRNKQ